MDFTPFPLLSTPAAPTIPVYPLYETLVAKIDVNEGIHVAALATSINNINQLSPEAAKDHYREIMALIYHFCQKHNLPLMAVPFKGQTMYGGKGILFTVENLLPSLQQLLAQYVQYYRIGGPGSK